MPVITKYASTGQAAGSPFNGEWTNPANVVSDNAVYATAAPGKNQEYASVFPIAFTTGEVPAGATINSALVEIQVKCSTTASVGIVTSTLFTDSAQATAIGATPGVQTPAIEPTVDTTYSYSRTPTETEIRDLWVRVQGTRGNNNTALTWSLDFVRVTVDYTEATTPEPVTGTGASALLAATSTGAGGQLFSGTATSDLLVLQSAASGTVTAPSFIGTAASSLQPIGSTASGTVAIPPISGTATSSLQAVQATGQGVLQFVGSGTSTLAATQSLGSGTAYLHITGTGASSLRPLTSQATGALGSAIVGFGASSLRPIESVAEGSVVESDTPAPTLPPPFRPGRIVIRMGRTLRIERRG